MIYKKFRDNEWELHHYQLDKPEEEIEFVEFLRELYPDMTWVSMRIVENKDD